MSEAISGGTLIPDIAPLMRATRYALAFLRSGEYIFRALGGGADVDFCRQIRSGAGIGCALSGRANGPCPGCAGVLLDPGLADGVRRQFYLQPEFGHLRQLSG